MVHRLHEDSSRGLVTNFNTAFPSKYKTKPTDVMMLTESLQSESLSDTTLESRLVTYASTTPAHAHKILTILVRVTKVLDDDIPVLHGTWAGHHPNNTPNSLPSIKRAVSRRPTTSPARRPHAHPTHLSSPHLPHPPARKSPTLLVNLQVGLYPRVAATSLAVPVTRQATQAKATHSCSCCMFMFIVHGMRHMFMFMFMFMFM